RHWKIGSYFAQKAAASFSMCDTKLVERARVHRIASRHHIVEQYADAADIALDRRRVSVQDLGRHVQWRAADVAPLGRPQCASLASPAEVHQDDPPRPLAHHVSRLDVTVHETRLV